MRCCAGAGSWDESLRLWYRIGHPNSTPKSSSGAADTPQGDKQEVRRPFEMPSPCLYFHVFMANSCSTPWLVLGTRKTHYDAQ